MTAGYHNNENPGENKNLGEFGYNARTIDRRKAGYWGSSSPPEKTNTTDDESVQKEKNKLMKLIKKLFSSK